MQKVKSGDKFQTRNVGVLYIPAQVVPFAPPVLKSLPQASGGRSLCSRVAFSGMNFPPDRNENTRNKL